MRHLGEIAFPTFSNSDQHSDIAKKCADYAAKRGLEDLTRNGHVTSPTGLQAYIDECGRHIDSERQKRQVMVLLGLLGGGAAAWALYHYYG